MTDLLFVYGSLSSAVDHPQGQRLRREATLVGPAAIQGRLFRLSWYPGLTSSDDPADIVYGEVYRLDTPAASLRWLDEYEGIEPSARSVASSDAYERLVCRVRVADVFLDAWVYLYRGDTSALQRVADGRWRG